MNKIIIQKKNKGIYRKLILVYILKGLLKITFLSWYDFPAEMKIFLYFNLIVKQFFKEKCLWKF